jgi:hypothetical protein
MSVDYSGTLFAALIVVPLFIATLVFWVRMLEDCAAHERGKARWFWMILLLAPNFAGVLIYYFVKWRPSGQAGRPGRA